MVDDDEALAEMLHIVPGSEGSTLGCATPEMPRWKRSVITDLISCCST